MKELRDPALNSPTGWVWFFPSSLQKNHETQEGDKAALGQESAHALGSRMHQSKYFRNTPGSASITRDLIFGHGSELPCKLRMQSQASATQALQGGQLRDPGMLPVPRGGNGAPPKVCGCFPG